MQCTVGRTFLDHSNHGKLGSWIFYYWGQMDCFNLLECTINILSNDVNASDAQSAPLIIVETSAHKKRNRSSHASTGTISEVDDDSAIRQVGDGLMQYVQASKRISHHSVLTSRRRELESRIYELSQNIRSNQMSRVRCTDENEKLLFDNFINEDKKELEDKQKELLVVATKLEDFND